MRSLAAFSTTPTAVDLPGLAPAELPPPAPRRRRRPAAARATRAAGSMTDGEVPPVRLPQLLHEPVRVAVEPVPEAVRSRLRVWDRVPCDHAREPVGEDRSLPARELGADPQLSGRRRPWADRARLGRGDR